jgi:hypothetical protein
MDDIGIPALVTAKDGSDPGNYVKTTAAAVWNALA